jgi:hypothetical protein
MYTSTPRAISEGKCDEMREEDAASVYGYNGTMRHDPLYFKKLGGKSHGFTVGDLINREGTEAGRPGFGRNPRIR